MSSASSSLPDALREVLLDPVAVTTVEVHGRTKAAVLVPLYEHEGALHAVFTRRHSDLRSHAGEISFPGGRRDAADEDLIHTALREAHEEIGLPPDAVELLGALQPTPTFVTNYAIYPFVGLIEPGRRWKPSAAEVEQVIELSLRDLLAGYERRRLIRRGVPFRSDTYTVGEHFIWGATARILGDLLHRLAPVIERPAA